MCRTDSFVDEHTHTHTHIYVCVCVTLLEFECHLDIQVESSDYVAAIEWRMNIQTKQNKPHMKQISIALEFTVYSS